MGGPEMAPHTPQRSSRPGEAVARLDLQRSGRPGEAVAPLDTSTGASSRIELRVCAARGREAPHGPWLSRRCRARRAGVGLAATRFGETDRFHAVLSLGSRIESSEYAALRIVDQTGRGRAKDQEGTVDDAWLGSGSVDCRLEEAAHW